MPKRVLVVEDEMLIRMLAVDMLEDLGFASDEAGTAAEALQKLQAAGRKLRDDLSRHRVTRQEAATN